MHSFLSSKTLIAVNTNSIIKASCRCQTWNPLCYKLNRMGLQEHVLDRCYIPCQTISNRLMSNIGNTSKTIDVPISSQINSFSSKHNCNPYFSPLGHLNSSLVFTRQLYVSSRSFDKEPLKPSSKVEVSVQALKQDLKESENLVTTTIEKAPPVKKSLRQRIVHELLHYYHGFRLLFIDIKISCVLGWRVLNGKTLTRREHRLLIRTVGDFFRLLPFSVFIIVPFMEFLLPFAIKFFPGMLPSTFQTATEKEDKMKQSLKVKLEMAKFLQKTLDDMAVVSEGHSSAHAKEFAEFFTKLRTSGEQATNEEIMKFSKLFEDEITLDSLSRQQLTALCRVLEIQPLGTNNFLRFQLRMKLRSLAADDKVIEKEGIDQLTPSELQQACRARGMRAYGMPTERLRSQLKQWLDLSLHQKVPPSLLLLSRALLLPDTIPTSDQLKATISVLPDTVAMQTKAAIGEREGKVDNKTKLEIIKAEEKMIEEERLERREELKKEALKKEELKKETVTPVDKEILVDNAPVLSTETSRTPTCKTVGIASALNIGSIQNEIPVVKVETTTPQKELSSTDLETLEDALDTVSKDKKKLLVEKEELDDLKEELAEYKEDVDDLNQVLKTVDKKVKVKESKAAKRLYNKVNNMIGKMDAVLSELEKEGKNLKEDLKGGTNLPDTEIKTKSQALVSIEELMTAIKQIQKVPDDSFIERITEVLVKIDDDQDGSVVVDDVLKVIELIGKENVKIGKKQLDEIIELIDKEEKIELEGQIERALAKETAQVDAAKQAMHQKVVNLEKEISMSKPVESSGQRANADKSK